MIERHPLPERAEWLEKRRQYLGASEVAAAAGENPHKSRLQLALEKTGRALPPDMTNIMRRGQHLEPAIIEYILEERPQWTIIRPRLWLCDPETRLAATPDAIAIAKQAGVSEDAVVQLKTVSAPVYKKDWIGNDPEVEPRPPDWIVYQALTEGMLWDTQQIWVAALVIDTFTADLKMFRVPRHPGAEMRILEVARDFWEAIDKGQDPPPDYAKDYGIIERLYPPDVHKEPALDLTGDNRIHEVLADRATAKSVITAYEDEVKALDAEIIAKLAGHTEAYARGWKITRRLVHRSEYTVKAQDVPTLRVYPQKEQAI